MRESSSEDWSVCKDGGKRVLLREVLPVAPDVGLQVTGKGNCSVLRRPGEKTATQSYWTVKISARVLPSPSSLLFQRALKQTPLNWRTAGWTPYRSLYIRKDRWIWGLWPKAVFGCCYFNMNLIGSKQIRKLLSFWGNFITKDIIKPGLQKQPSGFKTGISRNLYQQLPRIWSWKVTDKKEFPAGKTRGHGIQLLKEFLLERRPK